MHRRDAQTAALLTAKPWLAGTLAAGLAAVLLALGTAGGSAVEERDQVPPLLIPPPTDEGRQYEHSQPRAEDAETDSLIRSVEARTQFNVDGAGLTLAVLDTGLRATHVDFAGKVPAGRNFSSADGGDPDIYEDRNGHGTNVAGVAVGNGLHTGIAIGASVIPLKVLNDSGSGSFLSIQQALQWVLDNADTYNITCVNMSLGDGSNQTSDRFGPDPIHMSIKQLRQRRIAVCIAAGNEFFPAGSRQGMSYPAIFRESVSVGAVYDANLGPIAYGNGARAFSTDASRVCPFSQRLHPSVNRQTRTDIFAPGAALTAAGIGNDMAESTYHGTSQATPVTAGLVLLLQQYAINQTGALPTVDQLESWLRASTAQTQMRDGDDEDDNVRNTNRQFLLTDAVDALTAAQSELRIFGNHPCAGERLLQKAQELREWLPFGLTALEQPDQLLDDLRLYRDQVLQSSPTGRALAQLYYAHGDAVSAAVIQRPALLAEALQLLVEVRAAVVVRGRAQQTVTLPRATFDRGIGWLDQVAGLVPDDVRSEIQAARAALQQATVQTGGTVSIDFRHERE